MFDFSHFLLDFLLTLEWNLFTIRIKSERVYFNKKRMEMNK